MDIGKKKVSFPMVANYNSVVRYFVECGLDAQFIMPPKMTRRTLEIGSRYSPDYVCAPFKSTLGSMIDALEAGADTLVMTMGLCRLFTLAAAEGLKMVEYIDEIEAEYYRNCGFELNKGDYKKALDRFYLAMNMAKSKKDVEEGYREAKREFNRIPMDKPEQPLRVGIVGEYFTIMDPFSNLDLEQKLADMGVEVHRWMNITNRNLHYKGQKNLGVQIAEYCQYEMGPTSTANIWCAKNYAVNGFDGIIHVKSAGCTPEIDVMPILQNISADYKIPLI